MKIRFRIVNETNSGRRSGWTKHVTAVDTSKHNGYAFDGPFLRAGENELPVGSIIIQKNPEGSVKNGWDSARCYVVTADGLETVSDGMDWREDFLSFRDVVAEYLARGQEKAAPAAAHPELAKFTDLELVAEMIRRGIKVPVSEA